MKISGIVCEYNPFHNGHLYHIKKTRENGADCIIAVMSGSFVQRGELAASDKFSRASAALKGGADLVIEIPVSYSLSSAEYYARGAIHIMNAFGCVDEISFGCECGDIALIERAAAAADRVSGSREIKKLCESGISYPSAVSLAVKESFGEDTAEILESPNNVLAVEYVRAVNFFKSDIKPFAVKRKAAAHDSDIEENGFASASHIRRLISEGGDIGGLVPDFSLENLRETASLKRLERIILYKLRTSSLEEIKELPDVGQGLEYRIKEAGMCGSLDEIINQIKTKRYTMARIRRIIMSMLIGIKKTDLEILPPYGRILGMNKRGCEALSEAKKRWEIPFDTSPARLRKSGSAAERYVELESRACDIYGLAYEKIKPPGMNFTAKIRCGI